MYKNRVICLFLILSLLITSSACSNINDNNSSQIEITTTADYPTANSIEDVIDASDYIISGQFTKFNSSWNMARNPENIKEEDPNLYLEGRLYEFEVEKSLKGDLNKKQSITINLPYSISNEIDEFYMEPELNEEAYLFLKYDENFDCYYPALEPYRFTLAEDALEVKTNDIKINKQFSKSDKKIKVNELENLIINK